MMADINAELLRFNNRIGPQYLDREDKSGGLDGTMKAVEGSDGALHTKIVDVNGNPISKVPVIDTDVKAELEEINTKQSSLESKLDDLIARQDDVYDTRLTGSNVEDGISNIESILGVIDKPKGVPEPARLLPKTEYASGHRIMSFFEDRVFGRNNSGSQIWYFDEGDFGNRTGFYVDTEGTFNELVAISKTKVLASFTDSGGGQALYLVKEEDGDVTKEKVLEWEVDAPNFSFGVDIFPLIGEAEIIVMAEYGDKDPVDYPRHVHLSEDGGESWRIIFELPNEEENRTHLHGVHYDPYADKIWVCNGDSPASNVWYSDDWRNENPTWERVFPSLNAPTQFTSIYSTPECVLFGTDGAVNGIWGYKRNLNKLRKEVDCRDVEPLFIIDPSESTNYVARRFLKHPNGDGYYVLFSDTGTERGTSLLASYDGRYWFEILRTNPTSAHLSYLALHNGEVMFSFENEVNTASIGWELLD